MLLILIATLVQGELSTVYLVCFRVVPDGTGHLGGCFVVQQYTYTSPSVCL